jgi:hypothetical protein
VADQLYLSLWFPNFRFAGLPAATLSVLRQFPFSPAKPGVRAAVVYPLNWSEASIYQRIWEADEISDESPEALHAQLQSAIGQAMESLHEDYCYEFEVYWDLWVPAAPNNAENDNAGNDNADKKWELQPSLVRVAALGPDFDESAFDQNGHIRLDLGLDASFLQPELELNKDTLDRVQDNITKLIEMTARIEKYCGVSTRLLWSDDESSLAQKLLDRLQKLN